MNKQRETIYTMRRELLDGVDLRERIVDMSADVADGLIERFLGDEQADPEVWDWYGLVGELRTTFGLEADDVGADPETANFDEMAEAVRLAIQRRYEAKEALVGPPMRWLERTVMLQVVDQQWKDHLLAMDHLRQGIGFQGYAQKDPLVEYKRQSYGLFEAMMDRIQTTTLKILFNVRMEVAQQEAVSAEDAQAALEKRLVARRRRPAAIAATAGASASGENRPLRRSGPRIGRNERCPCGSGAKFKKCCGK
jgi:preprotein translocase subunit SecA